LSLTRDANGIFSARLSNPQGEHFMKSNIAIGLVTCWLTTAVFAAAAPSDATSNTATGKHTFQVEAAELIGGASKITDGPASGGSCASLAKSG
jgi:hypothetical protein